MKKSFIVIFAALWATSFDAGAQLMQFPQIPGDPVEYSRIVVPREPGSYPAIFSMDVQQRSVNSMSDAKEAFLDIARFGGEQTLLFEGELIKTWDITKRQVEDAIQEAFGRCGIRDRAHLARLYAQLHPVVPKEDQEAFYAGLQGNLVQGATSAMGEIVPSEGFGAADGVGMALTGAKYAQKIYNVASGKKTAAEAFGNAETALDAVGAAATAVKPVLPAVSEAVSTALTPVTIVYTITDAMYSDLHYAKHIGPKIAAAKAAGQIINRFYREANDFLRHNHGETAWLIYVKGNASTPFSFRGVRCTQNWKIEAKMSKLFDQEDTRANYNEIWERTMGGKYFGWVECDVTMDMSNYDKWFIPRKFILSEENTIGDTFNFSYGALGSGNPFREDALFYEAFAQRHKMDRAEFRFNANGGTRASLHYSLPVLMTIENRDHYGAKASEMYQVLEGETTVDGVDYPKPEYTDVYVHMNQRWELYMNGQRMKYSYEKVEGDEHIEMNSRTGEILRDHKLVIPQPYCPRGVIEIDFQQSLANGDVDRIRKNK